MKKIGILFMALAFASLTTATMAAERTEVSTPFEKGDTFTLSIVEPMSFEYVAPLEMVEYTITATPVSLSSVTVEPKGVEVFEPVSTAEPTYKCRIKDVSTNTSDYISSGTSKVSISGRTEPCERITNTGNIFALVEPNSTGIKEPRESVNQTRWGTVSKWYNKRNGSTCPTFASKPRTRIS